MEQLEYYGGNGYGGVPEVGLFIVKTRFRLSYRKFKRLSEARKYFDSINDDKFLWDIRGVPELLEGYIKNDHTTN